MRSLKSRLSLMVGGALFLLLLVGGVGVYSTYQQIKIGEASAVASVVLRARCRQT